jgi:hypothetical protein
MVDYYSKLRPTASQEKRISLKVCFERIIRLNLYDGDDIKTFKNDKLTI